MSSLDLEYNENEIRAFFRQLSVKAIPGVNARTLNRFAREAERNAIKETAAARKLPQKAVRNRLTLSGGIKERRVRTTKATRQRNEVSLEVWMRGIPVGTKGIGGKQNKQGVKATGKRLYVGTFRQARNVFKRKGADSYPLFVPKIGVREALTKYFDKHITESQGNRDMRAIYYKEAKRAVDREARKQRLGL